MSARPLIKICGLRTPADATACVAAGVDFGGINLVPGARRAVSVERAAALRRALGPVKAVGVFRDQPIDEVRAAAHAAGLEWVQLHGAEAPALCAALRAEGLHVIKALSVDGPSIGRRLAEHRGRCDLLLLDAPRPGRGAPFDYALLDELAPPRPWLLAGGLRPRTVAAALARLRPDGVDTASGVETDGRLDPARVLAFVAAARAPTRPPHEDP